MYRKTWICGVWQAPSGGLNRENLCPALLPICPVNKTPQVNHRVQCPENPHCPRSPHACPINRGYPIHSLVGGPAQPPIVRRSEIREESLFVDETEIESARLSREVVSPQRGP